MRREAAAVVTAAALLLTALAAPAFAATSAILADPSNGVAIFGYDPVSYRVEGAAREGSAAISVQVDGLTWRFASEANRQAFLDDPASYEPRLGGYDGAALARGFVSAGDPTLFAVTADGLYFFRSQENRASFAAEAALRRKAVEGWAALKGRVLP